MGVGREGRGAKQMHCHGRNYKKWGYIAFSNKNLASVSVIDVSPALSVDGAGRAAPALMVFTHLLPPSCPLPNDPRPSPPSDRALIPYHFIMAGKPAP